MVRQPVVRTLDPQDAAPAYRAYMAARSVLLQHAAMLVRLRKHDVAQELVALVDRLMPMDRAPERRVRGSA